jgi:hypothetical protein
VLFVLYLAIFAVFIVALTRGLEWLQQRQAGRHRVGVLEVFTAILAISTCVQVWAFIQSERAFIAVANFEIIGTLLVPDAPIRFAVAFHNSGRATAFINDANLTYTITNEAMPQTPQYQPGAGAFKGPVIAGGSVRATTDTQASGRNISAAFINGIQNGSHKLFVFGYVRFSDDFSLFESRVIGFCQLYNPRAASTIDAFEGCGLDNYVYAR